MLLRAEFQFEPRAESWGRGIGLFPERVPRANDATCPCARLNRGHRVRLLDGGRRLLWCAAARAASPPAPSLRQAAGPGNPQPKTANGGGFIGKAVAAARRPPAQAARSSGGRRARGGLDMPPALLCTQGSRRVHASGAPSATQLGVLLARRLAVACVPATSRTAAAATPAPTPAAATGAKLTASTARTRHAHPTRRRCWPPKCCLDWNGGAIAGALDGGRLGQPHDSFTPRDSAAGPVGARRGCGCPFGPPKQPPQPRPHTRGLGNLHRSPRAPPLAGSTALNSWPRPLPMKTAANDSQPASTTPQTTPNVSHPLPSSKQSQSPEESPAPRVHTWLSSRACSACSRRPCAGCT
jgi:hypothetical protein